MNFTKTVVATAVLALATLGAQAARLQRVASSTSGTHQTVLSTTDGDTLTFTGSSADLSGLAEVLAFGDAVHAGTLPVSGLAFSNEWVRSAALDASGAVTRFQATGSSTLSFNGAASLGDAVESASVGLDAELRVAADGEAAGTPVAIRLQLSAESLFTSTIAGAEDTPTFNLLVLDSSLDSLASYNGVALNGNDTLDVSFNSAVGQTLSFALTYANTLSVGQALLVEPQTVASSALLDGTMTVTAVPEPQSIALLLAGLGLVVAGARRRGR